MSLLGVNEVMQCGEVTNLSLQKIVYFTAFMTSLRGPYTA